MKLRRRLGMTTKIMPIAVKVMTRDDIIDISLVSEESSTSSGQSLVFKISTLGHVSINGLP